MAVVVGVVSVVYDCTSSICLTDWMWFSGDTGYDNIGRWKELYNELKGEESVGGKAIIYYNYNGVQIDLIAPTASLRLTQLSLDHGHTQNEMDGRANGQTDSQTELSLRATDLLWLFSLW